MAFKNKSASIFSRMWLLFVFHIIFGRFQASANSLEGECAAYRAKVESMKADSQGKYWKLQYSDRMMKQNKTHQIMIGYDKCYLKKAVWPL